MGTFFTVPQSDPAERARIFARADRVLRRTGESVYLSPEGERVTTGTVGHFNKGAFHLATDLHAPIVPMFISFLRASIRSAASTRGRARSTSTCCRPSTRASGSSRI